MTATMTPRKSRRTRRHWREVTGPWRRLRDGLFQTRDGRYRALWSDELGCWWLIERTDEGEHWQDTFPRLVDLRHHVAGVLEAEETHADAYMLRHRERAGVTGRIEVVRGGEVHATITVALDGSIALRGARLPMPAELAEAVSLALAEAAMTARALEAQPRGGAE